MTRPTLPTLDQLLKFDLPKFDLPTFDLPKFEVPGIEIDRLTAVAKDLAFVAVGFGVLTVQKLQVRRRELTAQATVAGNQVREFAAGICR